MSEESGKQRHGCLLGIGIVALGMLFWVIAEIGASAILPSGPSPYRAEAVSNAKQVGLALFTFREDYGSYPNKATSIEVRNNNPDTSATLGSTSSNDFFRQLFAAGTVDQEQLFFARTQNCRRPDNVLTGDKLLEKGEVGFAYVVSHAACKEKDFPLILTSLVKGRLLFDSKCFQGKAIILSADNACVVHSVDQDGHVWVNGKDFFDPSQPYWHGIPPKVVWPE